MSQAYAGTERDFSWREVGWRIRDMRLARGISQAQLGSACNLSGPGIFVIERGTINPQLKSLQSIAKALGCSVRQLLTGSTERRSDHDNLLEQMQAVLGSKDKDAVLALLNGLQSAQLILQSRPKGRGGLTIRPSDEVRRMFEASEEAVEDAPRIRTYRLREPSLNDRATLEAIKLRKGSSRGTTKPEEEKP
jgi:transcriptional regulator with XRE-family HTH domain